MFKKYWTIFWRFRSIHLMRVFEYRGDFFFWSFVSSMWSFFNFFFFDLIYRVSGSLAGWSRYELCVLLSVFTILDAFTWSVFYYNMKGYTQAIFNGELNQLLVKPVDAQFLIMTQHNSYNNIFRFAIGCGMLIWSFNKLGYQPSLVQWAVFILTLTFSFVFLYTIWFIFSTTAFYVEKLDNINEIIPTFRRAWQVPRSIYTGLVSFIFTVILPIGLITSVPSEILIGKSSWWWLVYFMIITTIAVVFSRWFFRVSLRRYVGQAN